MDTNAKWYHDTMNFFEYEDYDDYVKHQKKWYALKLGKIVYVKSDTIKQIVENKPFASSVLCHGTRSGEEQRLFQALVPSAKVVGSEIGDGCEQFPMTVQWDFNNKNPDWVGKFDIVYTNAFDHCITPVKTLKVWRDQLTPSGRLFVEYAENRSNVSESDPMGATNEEVRGFIKEAGMKVVLELTKDIKHRGRVFVCEK